MFKKYLSSFLAVTLVLGTSMVIPSWGVPQARACYNQALEYPQNAQPNEVVQYKLNVGTFPNKPRNIVVDITGGATIKSVSSQPSGAGFNGSNLIALPGNFLGQITMNIQMPPSGNITVTPRFEGDASDCTSSTAEFGETVIDAPELPKSSAPIEEEETKTLIGDPVHAAAETGPRAEPSKLPGTGPKENALLIFTAFILLLGWRKVKAPQV